MAELTLSAGITLIKGGLFPEGALVTVTEHGHALYAGAKRTPVIRCKGPLREGTEIYRGFRSVDDPEPPRRNRRSRPTQPSE
jgi:hypothetical protein